MIEVTQIRYDYKKGENFECSVLINKTEIVTITKMQLADYDHRMKDLAKCQINLKDGNCILCKESFEDIKKKIL